MTPAPRPNRRPAPDPARVAALAVGDGSWVVLRDTGADVEIVDVPAWAAVEIVATVLAAGDAAEEPADG